MTRQGGSLMLMLLLCIVSRAQAQEQQTEEVKYAAQTGTFRLVIVGPEGEPIPAAKIDLRFRPSQHLELERGEDRGNHRYGKNLVADAEGVVELKLPEQSLESISAGITAPGYGLFWAAWEMKSKSERLPAEYIARLDKGQSFGGVVVDEDGQPIVGAKVHPSIEYKKRESDSSQLSSGRDFTTDEQGRWSVHVVPASEEYLYVSISHPEFMKSGLRLSPEEYGLKQGEAPQAEITLTQGLSIAGTVKDSAGEPIEGVVLRTHVMNRTLEAVTNEQGRYEMKNLGEDTIDLVAMGKGLAPDLQTVSVRPDAEEVDFTLEPGNLLKVVVTDKQGKPVKRARVFFQDWRGGSHDDELDKVHSYTDENGVWVWENAPADAIRVDICPPGAMQIVDQMIQAGEENKFVSVPLLTIRGLVVDEESGRKIQSFRVIPGRIWPNRPEPFWSKRERFDGAEGSFTYKESRVDGKLVMRVEAEGYAPLISREIEWDEGRVGMALKLKRAAPTVIRVETADGSPAVGADIALGIKGAQISLRDGKFDSSTFADRIKTDKAGEFELKPQVEALVLFVAHESGYVAKVFDPDEPLEKLKLEAWGTVTGKIWRGPDPASEVKISVMPNAPFLREGLPTPRHRYSALSDEEGRFRMERVVPGELQYAERVEAFRSSRGLTSAYSHPQVATLLPGKVLEIEIGGTGHRVRGRFVLPEDFDERYDWEFAMPTTHLDVQMPVIPFPEGAEEKERQAWFVEWAKTPAGKAWEVASEKYFEARYKPFRTQVADDGSFEFFNLGPGEYVLEVKLALPGTSAYGDNILATLETKFVVPEFAEEFQTVDLGELELELVNPE